MRFATRLTLTFLASLSCMMTASSMEAVTTTLHFPSDMSMGRIFELPPSKDMVMQSVNVNGRFLGQARGELKVPAKATLFLMMDSRALEEPTKQVSNCKCPEIASARLRYAELSDQAAKIFTNMINLQRLDIFDCEFNDKGAAELSQLQDLRRLTIRSCGLNGNCLASLEKLSKLRYLNISSNTLKADKIKHLSKLTNIEALDVGRTGLTDEGMAEIAKLPHLMDLDINYNAGVSVAGLKHLRNCKSLKVMSISFTSVKPEDLLVLKGLSLKSVGLSGKVSPEVDKKLRACFPNCNFINKWAQKPEQDDQMLFAPTH